MVRWKLRLGFCLMLLNVAARTFAAEANCREMTVAQWQLQAPKWQGREVVAFASWCSSCKDKLAAAREKPEAFILISVFDDVSASERVLRKLGIKAECVRGEALTEYLGVTSLPWHQVIGKP
jgi:hypothetical protein